MKWNYFYRFGVLFGHGTGETSSSQHFSVGISEPCTGSGNGTAVTLGISSVTGGGGGGGGGGGQVIDQDMTILPGHHRWSSTNLGSHRDRSQSWCLIRLREAMGSGILLQGVFVRVCFGETGYSHVANQPLLSGYGYETTASSHVGGAKLPDVRDQSSPQVGHLGASQDGLLGDHGVFLAIPSLQPVQCNYLGQVLQRLHVVLLCMFLHQLHLVI